MVNAVNQEELEDDSINESSHSSIENQGEVELPALTPA